MRHRSYLGGSWDEADEPFEGIEGIAVDGSGNVYVTGTTTSPDFPTTAGAADRTLDGVRDIFAPRAGSLKSRDSSGRLRSHATA